MATLSATVYLDRILAYEAGDLSEADTLTLFQELVDSGLAWRLQGHYGRTASYLLQHGLIQPFPRCDDQGAHGPGCLCNGGEPVL